MKRALTLVLLAATTALTATAAVAQEDDAQRAEPRAERQAERAARREARQEFRNSDQAHRGERHSDRSDAQSQTIRDAWQGNANDAARARYERQAAENALRYGTREQRREVRQDLRQEHREDHGDHRDLHRDYRREHRDLHRGDPSRREHREWHRETERDHRREHRDTHRDLHRDYREEHRDLHRSDPSRREHRQWHREVNRDHRRYHREWDQNWRSDYRYDWQRYRDRNRSIFRVNPYYAPYRGYGYRRYGVGSILDSLFWGRNYWISDPWQYRLPPAPAGYQWVRYYNDVLLVDTWNGRVVDVIYDFFWY